jgi:DNA-directed RNA polymerase specialized sigma24 family protein
MRVPGPGSSDRSARFEELFRAEYGSVAAYVSRRTEPDQVDDLIDEVFLVAWRRLEVVPAEARPWLLAVARNVLGTHIRGARRGRALGVRLALNYVDQVMPSPPAVPSELLAALATLGEKDREALMLVNWEGLSPTDAARVLGDRPATFRMRLHRARARLRQALERENDPDGAVGVNGEEAANA